MNGDQIFWGFMFAFVTLCIAFVIYTPTSNNEYQDCVLDSTQIIGDHNELNGKIIITYHYYNSSYFCNGLRITLIEKRQNGLIGHLP